MAVNIGRSWLRILLFNFNTDVEKNHAVRSILERMALAKDLRTIRIPEAPAAFCFDTKAAGAKIAIKDSRPLGPSLSAKPIRAKPTGR
jgi:hypothetical protein